MTPAVANLRYYSLMRAEIRAEILDADLLLWRKPPLLIRQPSTLLNIPSRLIGTAGRGQYTHAAKAAWWGDELFCLEVREWRGGRAVTLESQVRKYSGGIDVYRANAGNQWPWFDRKRSTQVMKHFAGCQYGYWNIVKASWLHLPFVRLAVTASVDDLECDKHPPYCSQACAYADRIAGVDPVVNLPDRLTEPSDLSRSPFYQYLFTLEA